MVNALRTPLTGLLVLLLSVTAGAAAGETAVPAASTHVLVRVHKLTGLNAKNVEQVLFASTQGAPIPLNDLAQAGTLPTAKGIPEGTYREIKVGLANEIQIHVAGREPQRAPFRPDGPVILPMTGTLVFANGRVTAHDFALAPQRDTGDFGGGENDYYDEDDEEEEDDD